MLNQKDYPTAHRGGKHVEDKVRVGEILVTELLQGRKYSQDEGEDESKTVLKHKIQAES